MRLSQRAVPTVLIFSLLAGCSEAVYPPRPPAVPGPPVADPPHSRVVLHIALTQAGLGQLLEATVPKEGQGTFSLLGTRQYRWTRGPFELRFDAATGKIGVRADVQGQADLPAATMRFQLALSAEAQPVISADYLAQLQAPAVSVTSEDRLLRAAEWGGGVLQALRLGIERELRNLRIDLKPLLSTAYARLAAPLPFRVGDAEACAQLGLQGVEAGPTVLAGGVEKDLALIVAPAVTLPCVAAAPEKDKKPAVRLPPLHNVAAVPTGPFELTVPIAAGYGELQKAMSQAFTGGKLYFSKEHPELYLEHPEVYASGGQIVVKLHLDGYAKKGFRVHLSGDLYLTGHPQVRDNELEVPDMEPTVETRSALLKLKTALDGEAIRREARQALRLDISARLQAVRDRLSKELTIRQPVAGSGPAACLQAEVGRIEVTGVHPHEGYLRLYVRASARAAAYLPCPQ